MPDQVVGIRNPDFPGERLLVCLNPRLRAERARKREELLQATERIPERIAKMARHGRGPAKGGKEAIDRRVGRDASRRLVRKHFKIEVSDRELRWSRKQAGIEAEAQLDGIYVVRTSLAAEDLAAEQAVAAYKGLARVERAFRSLKTTQLQVRPVYVHAGEHVRGHVFLRMLAYYVEWHLRRRLAPPLSEDGEREQAELQRKSPVEQAEVSPAAKAEADSKRTAEGLPAQSLSMLLRHLSALTLNEVTLPGDGQHAFELLARPTPLQRKTFELPGVDPGRIASRGRAG